MTNGFTAPVNTVTIDAASSAGPLESWRHALRHGGINHLLPPETVISDTRQLTPKRRWDASTLDLHPVEVRDAFVQAAFQCQVWSPADTVTLVRLEAR